MHCAKYRKHRHTLRGWAQQEASVARIALQLGDVWRPAQRIEQLHFCHSYNSRPINCRAVCFRRLRTSVTAQQMNFASLCTAAERRKPTADCAVRVRVPVAVAAKVHLTCSSLPDGAFTRTALWTQAAAPAHNRCMNAVAADAKHSSLMVRMSRSTVGRSRSTRTLGASPAQWHLAQLRSVM